MTCYFRLLSRRAGAYARTFFFSSCFLDRLFYFPAQLVGGFLPSAIFWTSRGHRCRPFSPPVRAFNFLWRIGFSIPTARRFSSNVANSRSRVLPIYTCYCSILRPVGIKTCGRGKTARIFDYHCLIIIFCKNEHVRLISARLRIIYVYYSILVR